MAAVTAAQIVAITDKLAQEYLAELGDSGSGFGDGDASVAEGSDWGSSLRARELGDLVLGFGDVDVAGALLPAINLYNGKQIGYKKRIPLNFRSRLTAVSQLCRNAGLTTVVDLASFIAYKNTGAGGPWNCLVAPEYKVIHDLVFATALNAKYVYSPAIADMGHRAFGGSFVAGTDVNTGSYGGVGLPQAVVTSWSGTSGTLTVTGNGLNSAGVAVTGHTWTATIDDNDTFTLTPAVPGDLLQAVTNITLPGTMAAGTVTVVCALPAGRTAITA